MVYEIDDKEWHICRICNLDVKTLAKQYGGTGIYYTKVFTRHLENDHNITIEEYFTNAPICPCNLCNKKCRINKKGSEFKWVQPCGRYKGTLEWSEKAKTERCGSNNPMYGKPAWNKNLSKENNSSVKKTSDKLTGRTMSSSSKEKMSNSAKCRKIHGHTGIKHSEESKQLMRDKTLLRIKNGEFLNSDTKPVRFICKQLDDLNIKYEKEKILSNWAFDIYLLDYDIYVEVDGDYFHSNPKIYKNGPVTSTQKRNHYRDYKKNEFCKNNNISLLRFWESDILNNSIDIIESIKCIQKK